MNTHAHDADPSGPHAHGARREHWATHLGFIMAAAGSAIGLGNIWKFPYITGENGGGAFVLVYLLCIAVIGVPVMLAEFAIGRHTQRNPVGAFARLSGDNPLWKLVGFMGVLSGFLIMSFYSVVGGWTLAYILKGMSGEFAQYGSPDVAWQNFLSFTGDPLAPVVFSAVFIAFCAYAVYSGVRKGIERWCDVLMPALFIIIVAIMLRGLTLPGAIDGVKFFLKPDFSALTPKAFLIALGHAFFSLSLGMGAMITYGSYVDRQENLWKSAVLVSGLDTGISILAGLAIFPAVFAFGFDPAAGPGLVFKVLPAVFAKMPGGAFLWGTAFFVLLAIAALTSGMSLLEVVTAYFVDEKGYRRHVVAIGASLAIFLLSIPCALSFGLLSDVQFFGKTVFDVLDYLASNMFLPLGGLLICLFTAWRWGTEEALKEINAGSVGFSRVWWGRAWGLLVKFVSPVAVVLVLLYSLGVIGR
jgi:NSS family neurotransmitter:Na+ symporter